MLNRHELRFSQKTGAWEISLNLDGDPPVLTFSMYGNSIEVGIMTLIESSHYLVGSHGYEFEAEHVDGESKFMLSSDSGYSWSMPSKMWWNGLYRLLCAGIYMATLNPETERKTITELKLALEMLCAKHNTPN